VFNTFARIFALLSERYPDLWRVDRAYVDALDAIVRAMITGDEARARDGMQELLELRDGVVLLQLQPQPLRQLGRSSLSRPAPPTRASKRKR
jgi:hypothetical protein